MTLSNALFQLAGFFERYRNTGGTITAEEAAAMSGKLMMLGEGVASLEVSQKAISDEFDRYIEDQARDSGPIVHRPRSARAFQVIEGSMV